MQEFIRKLRDFLDENSLYTNPAEIAAASAQPFNYHGQPPMAVAFPIHLSQFRQLFSLCAETGTSLRFRGGSTSLATCPRPDHPWILVKTSKFSRILDFSPDARRITLQAGVSCQQLTHLLRPYNLELPGISAHPCATIGGALALNLLPGDFPQTPTCASALIDLGVLTPAGEPMTLALHNGSSGEFSPELPLASLFLGSQGQTGLILKAAFRLENMRPAQCFMAQGELSHLINVIQNLLAQQEQTPGLMLLDGAFAKSSDYSSNPTLLLKYRGLNCKNSKHQPIILSEATTRLAPQPIDAQDFPLPHMLATGLKMTDREKSLFVLTGAPENLERMLTAVKDIAKNHNMELAWFGYPSIARMYFIFFHESQKQWQAAAQELFALKLIFGDTDEIDTALGMTEEEWRHNKATLSRKFLQLLDPQGLFSNWRN